MQRIAEERVSAQARAAAAKPLEKPGRPTKEEHRDKGSVTTSLAGRGADYLAARIAHDAPAVLAEMQRGEHFSVRAAARKGHGQGGSAGDEAATSQPLASPGRGAHAA